MVNKPEMGARKSYVNMIQDWKNEPELLTIFSKLDFIVELWKDIYIN